MLRKTEVGNPRNRKTIDMPETEAHHKPKKDTRKWCKGVPGREHLWEVVEYAPGLNLPWIKDRCITCGRLAKLRLRSPLGDSTPVYTDRPSISDGAGV